MFSRAVYREGRGEGRVNGGRYEMLVLRPLIKNVEGTGGMMWKRRVISVSKYSVIDVDKLKEDVQVQRTHKAQGKK